MNYHDRLDAQALEQLVTLNSALRRGVTYARAFDERTNVVMTVAEPAPSNVVPITTDPHSVYEGQLRSLTAQLAEQRSRLEKLISEPRPPKFDEALPATFERHYGAREIGERFGVSRDLVIAEQDAGRLAYVRFGNRRVVPESALLAYIETRAVGNHPNRPLPPMQPRRGNRK